MKKITIKSPAKINLTLDVLSKKKEADFHEIKTIYHKVNLCDEIKISKSEEFEIVGEFDFPMKENLIFKAWQLIGEFINKKDFYPVKVKIKKDIPIGGGLGGGSSNFATFVQGYFDLFNLGDIPKELIKKSGKIGKDIPFFFSSFQCAIGTGYGEIIGSVPFDVDLFKNISVYIYVPPFKNSTAEMFQKLQNFDTKFTNNFLKNPNLKNCGNSFNVFFKEDKYKEIILLNFSNDIFLTGSGSCFYSFKPLRIKNCKIIETNLYSKNLH